MQAVGDFGVVVRTDQMAHALPGAELLVRAWQSELWFYVHHLRTPLRYPAVGFFCIMAWHVNLSYSTCHSVLSRVALGFLFPSEW